MRKGRLSDSVWDIHGSVTADAAILKAQQIKELVENDFADVGWQ